MADQHNNLERIDSFQYPAAHLGHLSQGQLGALERFKVILAKGKYYRPADPQLQNPPSHDDETLL